jgi:hypothetical protein
MFLTVARQDYFGRDLLSGFTAFAFCCISFGPGFNCEHLLHKVKTKQLQDWVSFYEHIDMQEKDCCFQ